MARTGSLDRVESATNITLVLSTSSDNDITYSSGSFDDPGSDAQFLEVPISRLDTTKDIEINEIREGSLKANGYSVQSISYSGTMMFKGSRFTKTYPDSETGGGDLITDFLYDDNGVPQPFLININHELNDEPERYKNCLVTSESYEVRNESETETAFDWVAMDRSTDIPDA